MCYGLCTIHSWCKRLPPHMLTSIFAEQGMDVFFRARPWWVTRSPVFRYTCSSWFEAFYSYTFRWFIVHDPYCAIIRRKIPSGLTRSVQRKCTKVRWCNRWGEHPYVWPFSPWTVESSGRLAHCFSMRLTVVLLYHLKFAFTFRFTLV